MVYLTRGGSDPMGLKFRKEKKPGTQLVKVVYDDAVTVKDLANCLFEEYRRIEQLKKSNEVLLGEKAEASELRLENKTQLTVINKLQDEVKEKMRDIDRKDLQLVKRDETIEQLKTDYAIQQAELNKLRQQLKETTTDHEDPYELQVQKDKQHNKTLEQVITKIRGVKALGKNQALDLLESMKL
jgi:chromosome segregation ATPase